MPLLNSWMSTVKEPGSWQIQATCLCEEGACVQAFHRGFRGTTVALLQQIAQLLTLHTAQVAVQLGYMHPLITQVLAVHVCIVTVYVCCTCSQSAV